MKNKFLLILILFLIGHISCSKNYQVMNTVTEVDLEKYAGKWYDYAHLPARFLEGCSDITAEYSLTEKNYVRIYNRCIKESSGKVSDIKGKAFIVKGSNNSKLKVQFFWPFRANYWILDLDENYQYALVGGPSRRYLWILTRSPELEENIYKELLEKAKRLGFPVEQMIRTEHH